MRNRKRIRNLTVGFIAFMSTVVLVALTLIIILEQTLFSAAFLNRAAHQSAYYTELSDQINTQIQDYGLGSGIPAKVLEKTVSAEEVQKDFEAYTYQAYYGNSLTIEKEPFLEQVKLPITAYADQQKQPLTADTQAGVERFAERSYEAYSQSVKLPFLPALGQRIQIFSSNLLLFKIILGSSLALLLMLIVYLMHWWWHRLARYLSFIAGGSGLMLMIAPAILLLSGVINRMAITSKPLYHLLTTYLSNSLGVFIFVGAGFLLVSLLLAFLSSGMRRKLA